MGSCRAGGWGSARAVSAHAWARTPGGADGRVAACREAASQLRGKCLVHGISELVWRSSQHWVHPFPLTPQAFADWFAANRRQGRNPGSVEQLVADAKLLDQFVAAHIVPGLRLWAWVSHACFCFCFFCHCLLESQGDWKEGHMLERCVAWHAKRTP